MDSQNLNDFRARAEKTAAEQRALQEAQRQREADEETQQDGPRGHRGARGAASNRSDTAEARARPRNPLPPQQQDKPGSEAQLDPQPQSMAPAYRGSGKLRGKVALITGGDSGIGRAVAILFAREGADVAIVYLNEDADAAESCRRVRAEGARALSIAGDVRDPAFCAAAVQHVVDKFGQLDVLVNNAAFQQHVGGLQELSDAQLDMTVRTNLYGYVYMTRAALACMKSGDAIVNTGSETGLFGSPGLLDYAATKGAIHAFTKSLASSLVEQGIRVNAVAPGPVWTPLNPADATAKHVSEFGAKTAMHRPAQPEEIAPAYVFLASSACSSYITGIELPIMGGTPGGS